VSGRGLLALAAIVCVALLASGISPHERLTWWMEVLPAMVALGVLFATRHSYPLTPLLYILITAHCLVLIYGGAYTYARVPLGFWLQDLLGTERNPYDKIGHFMQGFVPAMIAREILLRGGYVRAGKMAAFLFVCVALAVSAVYELVEWWAALFMGQGADDFLGTQGDEWDTQSDMFLALLGACAALVLLRGLHDRQLRGLSSVRPRSASTG
jgi:putative membrane protein